MPRCQPRGLLASAHTENWTRRSLNVDLGHDDEIALLPTLWRSTAIRCNRFCDGSTALNFGGKALEAATFVVFVACREPVPASFMVLYIATGYSEPTSAMEIVRAVVAMAVAATAAGVSTLAFFVWLAFIAAIIHTVRSAMFIELELLSDCARCGNEAHWCRCGRQKKAIPPGSLDHLATVVGRQWRKRAAARENTCEL